MACVLQKYFEKYFENVEWYEIILSRGLNFMHYIEEFWEIVWKLLNGLELF